MKTIVSPKEVARTISARRNEPEIVAEGLRILKICSEVRGGSIRLVDLDPVLAVQMALSGVIRGEKQSQPLVDLVHEFTGAVTERPELDGFEILCEQFPEWAITLHDVTVSRDFQLQEKTGEKPKKTVELLKQAIDLNQSLLCLIMMVPPIVEGHSFNMSGYPSMEFKKIDRILGELRKQNHPKWRALAGFLSVIFKFYQYLKEIDENKNETKMLVQPEQKKIIAKHEEKLMAFKLEAEDKLKEIPTTIEI